MVWYAEEANQIMPTRGKSSASSVCVPTLVGSFIGDSQMEQLKCSRCQKIKPEDEFSVNRQSKTRRQRSYYCFICERKLRKEYLSKNPHIREGRNKRIRERWKNREYQERVRGYYYKHRYGITIETYEEMLKNQNGACAICGKNHKHKTQKYLHVDHNHKTGQVRGLLCGKCNHAIGLVNDDVNVLSKIIEYLYRHQETI